MRHRLVLAVAAVLAFAAGRAHAQKPVSMTTEYSPYEKETIRRALKTLHVKMDPAPEGKIIRRIETLRLDVLEDRDPIPDEVVGIKTRKLLNSLHYTTRDWIIRREMLQHEGERYVQVLIDETARNIRARMPLEISISIIIPIASDIPGTVDVLVITKDIWSLRLSFDMSVTPGGVQNFLLVPQETNLLGLHHTAQTSFRYQPESYTFGLGYSIPRFGYSWIGASAGASIIINRARGTPEGSSMSVNVGQGLYSTRTPWSWGAQAGYTVQVVRRYSNARVLAFNAQSTPGVNDRIPYQYKAYTYSAQVGVTRSFGWGFKNNFSLTANATTFGYETFDLSAYLPAAANEFRAVAIPRGEARVYPALTWESFTTNFLRTTNVNTLALQEDFRLGHNVTASIYPVTRAAGSSRDFVGLSASFGYAVPLGDGLVGGSVNTFAEDQLGQITDGSVGASFGAFTPKTPAGRLVMNASFSNRYANYLNSRTFLGGDNRLRGYPTNYFFGKDTILYNVEFRSRPVEILKAQLGGVAFFDAGDAANGFDMLRAKQSVGFGLRALFPQVNRLVFRLDFAFPLKRGPFPETGVDTPVDPFGFYFAFDQAFAP